jgi:hypothetical protein
MKYPMQKLEEHPGVSGRVNQYICRRGKPGLIALCILMAFALIVTGCGKSRSATTAISPEARDASLRQIAADYARTGDLAQAQAALDKLRLANPTQLLVSLAETDVSAGRPAAEIVPLASLVEALGARSAKLIAYLEPTPTDVPPTFTPSPIPPSPTTAPTATPTTEPPTATAGPPTLTPTITLTSTPQKPRAIAASEVNLRGGPGKGYPVVGKLAAGKEMEILGRNASGDWWQLAWPGGKQAWVTGTVVQIIGPIDTVAVAKNIPPTPVAATRAPKPTAAPPAPAAAPKPSTAYVVRSVRAKSVGEDSQTCGGGEHNVFVLVVDPAGNPLDGVRVRDIWTGTIEVTGAQGKGAGRVNFDIYKDGGAQVEIVDDGNTPISPQSRGMSSNLPDWDMFLAAGYCNCKPYPDEASCQSGWQARDFAFMPMSHYAYEVTFQRTF